MLKADLGPEAVHLCIDMQRLSAEGGPWATPWMERVLPAVAMLVEGAPARSVCSSCDESHDALIDLYNLRFDVQIELSTSDEVLAQWHV